MGTATKTITRKSTDPRWNWLLFSDLYIRGIDIADIRKMPEFEGLSEAYAHNKASINGWKEKREAFTKRIGALVDKSVSEEIKRVKERFKKFMLGQIESEMGIAENRLKTTSVEAQSERLKILLDMRKIAAPSLGLDEFDPNEEKQRGFKTIYNVQINHGTTPQPMVEANHVDDTANEIMERIRAIPKIEGTAIDIEIAATRLESDLEENKRKAQSEKGIVRRKGNGKRMLGMPVAKS